MTVTAPAAPRALTPPEKAELRARLEARLREAGDGDAADDEGLLAFVLDMAENGEAAGRVPEELLKLEMCSEAEAEKIGACLAEFFDSLEARQQGLQAEAGDAARLGEVTPGRALFASLQGKAGVASPGGLASDPAGRHEPVKEDLSVEDASIDGTRRQA